MGKRKCSCLIAQPRTATDHFRRLCDVRLQPIPNQSQCRNSLGLSGSRIRPQVAVEQQGRCPSLLSVSLFGLWQPKESCHSAQQRRQRGTNRPRSRPEEQDSARKGTYRAPQTGADALSLTAFSVRLDGTLSNQMELKLSLPFAGSWIRWPSTVSSEPNRSAAIP